MLTIMRLSIIEQMRRRVLRVLAVLTVIIVLITAWGFDQLIISSRRFMDDVPLEVIESSLSQVLVFVMFMFSFVLAMVAASLGAPAISGEVESGQALALFARPLSRTRFVVGRWMGLAAVVGAYALVSGGLELLTVAVVTGFVPRSPIGAMGYLAAQGVVILTLSVVLSTRLPAVASGAIGIVLFGITWVVGIMGSAGRLLGSTALSDLSRVLRFVFPSDALWRRGRRQRRTAAALPLRRPVRVPSHHEPLRQRRTERPRLPALRMRLDRGDAGSRGLLVVTPGAVALRLLG